MDQSLPLDVIVTVKEEITEERDPLQKERDAVRECEQIESKYNFSHSCNVVIKEEYDEQGKEDSEKHMEQRVKLEDQDKKNYQEPSNEDEDEQAVEYDKFVDQCVLLPTIVEEKENVQDGNEECMDNEREGVNHQYTVRESENTEGQIEQLQSSFRINIYNVNKEVNTVG